MKNYQNKILFFMSVFMLHSFWVSPAIVKSAPPILSEESLQAEKDEAEALAQGKEMTPEEKKKEKEEQEQKATIRDLRRRQASDEKSIRVRSNFFPSAIPNFECTAGDRARARLEKIVGSGGVVILGDINIASKNEANVEKNEGSLKNEVNVNIINEDKRRC